MGNQLGGSGSELIVKVLTFNLGKNKKTIQEWYAEILKEWDIITKKDYDILCLCLQEDWNGAHGQLGEAVGEYLRRNGYTQQMKNIMPGLPDILGNPFSVKLFIYAKSILPLSDIKKEMVCLQKQYYIMCTKATVGISFKFQDFQIIVMSSHFPMKSKQLNLGYTQRVDAINESLQKIHHKLRDQSINNFVGIWGGDLNFRKKTPLDDSGKNMGCDTDQLTSALKCEPKLQYTNRDLYRESPVEFAPTCKMRTCNKDGCPICRKQPGYIHNCYEEESNGSPRIPSNCDRILHTMSGNVTVETLEYDKWVGSKSVMISDHDLVYSKLKIKF